MTQNILTVTQAARLAGCTPAAIYKSIFRDRLRAFKLGRHWCIRRDDLQSWRHQREKQ